MNQEPLDAIGQYFEMPTKEAFLNKINPILAFENDIGLDFFLTVLVLSIMGFFAFLFWRNRS
jgi:hypothetical protein